MLRIGLTGGIACGKTVVRRLLSERGAFTVDADEIVHELLAGDRELIQRIGDEFGNEVLGADGSVDRSKLGALVFADADARARLNAIVHPRVQAEYRRRLDEAARRGWSIGVVDAALMVETGTFRNYDRLIVVHCPRSTQIGRLRERDGLSPEDAERRVDAQIPVEEKKKFADFLIDTSGSLEETSRQVDRLWPRLEAEADEAG